MRKLIFLAVVLSSALVMMSSAINVDAVTEDIYFGHGTTGGGAPYSDFVGSFTSPDVMFATNTGCACHPFGLGSFGTDITGFLNVLADGSHMFALNSDDGS